jgi:hypothetical protein
MLALGGCGSTTSVGKELTGQDLARLQRQGIREITPVRRKLQVAGDAASLAAAAALTFVPDDVAVRNLQRLELLNAAVALEPRRPALLWLQLEACEAVDSCDLAQPTARLREVDPANGVAWYPMLFRATKLKQADEVARLLRLTADSERLDIYWNASVVLMTDAVVRTGSMKPAKAMVMVIGALAAALPALSPITGQCRGAALESDDRLAICRKLAGVLRAGDSLIPESVGLAMARQLWPAGTGEHADAEEAYRAMKYLGQLSVEHEYRQEQGRGLQESSGAELLAQMRVHRREQDAMASVLIRAGLNVDPPADWKGGPAIPGDHKDCVEEPRPCAR